eukprot:TRINITY_DN68543_c0_g1_i1.p1 TRINITY_DN68543_c0_g1~~TRINITY_DN68543_c0_g1_i1.p1  ORF type:complete len:496 (+),score=91.46 TRINITY_DN68543_c0_g1_i1:68-1489(+)
MIGVYRPSKPPRPCSTPMQPPPPRSSHGRVGIVGGGYTLPETLPSLTARARSPSSSLLMSPKTGGSALAGVTYTPSASRLLTGSPRMVDVSSPRVHAESPRCEGATPALAASCAAALDAEQVNMTSEAEAGPLWTTIKTQLYKSEVSHIKRLVGEPLIQQNKVLWNELNSLRQILSEFQDKNNELIEGLQQQVAVCGTQHRDLLRRQAQIIIEDVRAQAESCGHVLEDLLPEFRDDQELSTFIYGGAGARSGSLSTDKSAYKLDHPRISTPSTRPSSSSGRSSTQGVMTPCGSPDPSPLTGVSLGRHLSLEDLSNVADGIREALEEEQSSLSAAVSEHVSLLEAEDSRRMQSLRETRAQPSTQKLQQFLHKLQDLSLSPTLKTLALTGPASPSNEREGEGVPTPMPIAGGAHVRRLQAMIMQRRRATPPSAPLGAVPETPAASSPPSRDRPGSKGRVPQPQEVVDPFFDEPFA